MSCPPTRLRVSSADNSSESSHDSRDQSATMSPVSGINTSLTGMTAVSTPMPAASASFNFSEVDDKIVEYKFLRNYDTQALLTRMKAVAIEAGDMMLSADVTKIDTKNNTSDVVTETDKAIERMVKSKLLASFPKFEFFGEETSIQDQKLSDEATFVIDPIDGTLNFTHGLPNFAISIAVVYFKLPVAGVIYKPSTDEMWSAITGSGAFKEHPKLDTERNNHHLEIQRLTAQINKLQAETQVEQSDENTPQQHSTSALPDSRIRLPLRLPTPLGPLNTSLLALEWGNERTGPRWSLRLHLHQTLLTADPTGTMIQSIRSMGSAALNFCYVAEGRLDAFYEPGCRVWDIAAGWCILKQTGGKVFSVNPGAFEPSVEGRLYFAIRAAEEKSQVAFAEKVWAKVGEGRFEYGEKKEAVMGKKMDEDEKEMNGLGVYCKVASERTQVVAPSTLAVAA